MVGPFIAQWNGSQIQNPMYLVILKVLASISELNSDRRRLKRRYKRHASGLSTSMSALRGCPLSRRLDGVNSRLKRELAYLNTCLARWTGLTAETPEIKSLAPDRRVKDSIQVKPDWAPVGYPAGATCETRSLIISIQNRNSKLDHECLTLVKERDRLKADLSLLQAKLKETLSVYEAKLRTSASDLKQVGEELSRLKAERASHQCHVGTTSSVTEDKDAGMAYDIKTAKPALGQPDVFIRGSDGLIYGRDSLTILGWQSGTRRPAFPPEWWKRAFKAASGKTWRPGLVAKRLVRPPD